MLLAAGNLCEYLEKRYNNNNIVFTKEVKHMTETLYNPKVAEKARREGYNLGIEQIARNLLLDGCDIEFVKRNTQLSIDKIKEIAKNLKQE